MWLPTPKASGIKKGGGGAGIGGGNGLVAVAIDKDKGSQYAIKWAADTLLTRGQTVILIHVLHTTSSPVSSKFVLFKIHNSNYLFAQNSYTFFKCMQEVAMPLYVTSIIVHLHRLKDTKLIIPSRICFLPSIAIVHAKM